MRNVCIYHENCPDGLTSAALLYKVLENDGIEFIPCGYRADEKLYKRIVESCTYKTVYIVDFSLPEHVLTKINMVCERFVVIDHHDTDLYQKQPKFSKGELVLDIESGSGAMMVAEYLRKRAINFPPHIQHLIKHISDYDTWMHEKNSVADVLNAFCNKHRHCSVEEWSHLLFDQDPYSVMLQATELHQEKVDLVNKIYSKDTHQINIELPDSAVDLVCYGFEIFPDEEVPLNEVCEKIYTNKSIPGLSYKMIDSDGVVKFSVRTDENTNMFNNMSALNIAKLFGGGGHRNAAGFRIPIEQCEVDGRGRITRIRVE